MRFRGGAMFTFSNIKIGRRLAIGFSLVLLCAISLLALGLWRMTQLQEGTALIVNEELTNLTNASEMRENGWLLALSMRKIARPADSGEGDRESKKIITTLASYDKSEAALKKHLVAGEGKSLFDSVTERKKEIDGVVAKMKALISGDNYFERGQLLTTEFLPLHEKWMESLRALTDYQQKEMNATYEASKENFKSALLGMLILGIITIAAAAFIAYYITKSITQPLHQAAHVADTIANGDLTVEIQQGRQDEIGQLITALKKMTDSLVQIVSNVRRGTETIGVASREIAAGNANLSSRTETQASSLQETASSMETLTDAVRKNAQNANKANQMVVSASEFAVKGGNVVQQVVTTMGSIKDSSRKIVDIIGVIDGIAFQTNILALNAAVEAARAGEQGRGFAVVATEVRNLAQRSASAAKEIKALINDSVDKVNSGGELVDEAGKTMNEIVTSVKYVADIMSEISTASQEQSTGIEEVNRAVTQMDEMTQQNSALVEQAAAAAESLKGQASNLEAAVSVFKIRNDMVSAAKTQNMPRRSPLISAGTTPSANRNVAAPVNRNSPQLAVIKTDDWEEF
jgi:methyl-accepting chemotaxis protein